MQLSATLKTALDDLFQETSLSILEQANERLSSRYRQELRDGRMHLDDRKAALAYVAARFPATFAAVHASLCHIVQLFPDFSPLSQLDVGAGPATAVLAAHDVFSSLKCATLVEQSDDIIDIGKNLTAHSEAIERNWHKGDLATLSFDPVPNADLVTLSYVLDELSPDTQDKLIDTLWQKTNDVLVLVEPGTPAGWRRLMRQRARLINQNANIIAPCPHQLVCPVIPPDWCHFRVRVERSRIHRLTKQATVPFEDEKYCYLVCSRNKNASGYYRILSRPLRSSGRIKLSVCTPNGEKNSQIVTRKSKDLYRKLRKAEWGDAVKK